MIELTWTEESIINKELLEPYITTMNARASFTDEFSILMPILVYRHIIYVGINAELTVLPNTAAPGAVVMTGMVWIRVKKCITFSGAEKRKQT